MNPKKIFILSLLLSGALFRAHAETVGDSITYEFAPHWYIQGAFGYQYTIGETKAGELSSPNAQIAFGYQFTPVWGLRLNVNGWQSRGGYAPDEFLSKDRLDAYNALTGGKDLTWKWNYVAPALDVMVDLTNAIGGYKHDRLFHVGIMAGIGANIYFNNKEAQQANSILKQAYLITDDKPYFEYLWDGCYTSIMGQAGLTFDFHITDNFDLGLECYGNMLNDHYNSKNAQNPDWYINALVTATYRFGKTHKKQKIQKQVEVIEEPIPVKVVEEPKVVETVVEVPAPAPVKTDLELLNDYLNGTFVSVNGQAIAAENQTVIQEVFFTIGKATVREQELSKINAVVEYLKANPDTKVILNGFADVQTGTKERNQILSQQRVDVVKGKLVKAGISEERIITHAYGCTIQPHKEQAKNRVCICLPK